eukprot:GSA25T00017938001.1
MTAEEYQKATAAWPEFISGGLSAPNLAVLQDKLNTAVGTSTGKAFNITEVTNAAGPATTTPCPDCDTTTTSTTTPSYEIVRAFSLYVDTQKTNNL